MDGPRLLGYSWGVPAPFPISKSLRVGEDFAILAAGTFDLTAQSGKPARCVRRVHCYNAATITSLKNAGGVDTAPGAVPAGTVFDVDASSIVFTGGPIMVCW